MGIDYYANIGPYVVCQNSTMEVEETVDGCPKCQRHRWEKVKFCPDCGTLIAEFSRTVIKHKINAHELVEVLDEALSLRNDAYNLPKNVDVWKSNRGTNSFVSADLADRFNYDIGLLDLTDINIMEQITAFKEQFKKELVVLREQYGPENVNVCWGVVRGAN